MPVVHELSWSSSRAATFETCRRRYFFDYYGSWLGWDSRASPERRRAYVLKKMTRLPMLAGEALHRSLQAFFEARRRGVQEGERAVLERAVRRLREGYRESRDGRWRERPARFVHLAEHHYREPCIDEASGAAREYGGRLVERLKAAVAAFFADPRLEAARCAEPGSFLACEEMGTFELFAAKVYAVPDFAWRDPEGRVRILDWKSGRPRPEDRFQLAVYTLYARALWSADPEEVVCADAYLAEGELHEARFAAQEIAEVEARIASSLEAMRALHFDADRADGDRERFPMLDPGSESDRECGSCNYRELCQRP